MQNPFAVQTPEHLSAEDMELLFVDEMTDYPAIEATGHTIIYGPRGAGKSMIFRFMQPDCQMKHRNRTLQELDYYAAYISVKQTEFNIAEFDRLETLGHAPMIFAEHIMISSILSRLFNSMPNLTSNINDRDSINSVAEFYNDFLQKNLIYSGFSQDYTNINIDIKMKLSDALKSIGSIFDTSYKIASSYLRRSSFLQKPEEYKGPLFGFMDFLSPVIENIINLPFMPPQKPLYILIDDADNFSKTQTMILNSWIAHRTTGHLCIKVAAQTLNYKTHRTINDKYIEAPHDFAEVQIYDIYTGNKDRYKKRISSIVKRRLQRYGIDTSPEDFFPVDQKQEEAIRREEDKIRAEYEKKGRGYRCSDDVARYARPNYIRSLSGSSKSGSTYSYAGFDQLVHISSGVTRYFLEAASRMFAQTISDSRGEPVKFIPDGIQDSVVRKLADEFLFNFLDEIKNDEPTNETKENKIEMLGNLIHALGGMFRAILLSDGSERRIFSIAFSKKPSDEVKDILDLGVKYGYFHKSTIGNKEGTGRVPLYIMNRRLAPAFKLDPTSFAGYKFVTDGKIREAISNPNTLIRQIQEKGIDKVMSDSQGRLDL